jgi:hypothetical protein
MIESKIRFARAFWFSLCVKLASFCHLAVIIHSILYQNKTPGLNRSHLAAAPLYREPTVRHLSVRVWQLAIVQSKSIVFFTTPNQTVWITKLTLKWLKIHMVNFACWISLISVQLSSLQLPRYIPSPFFLPSTTL